MRLQIRMISAMSWSTIEHRHRRTRFRTAGEQSREVGRLARVEPGARLVEEQEARLEAERSADLEPPLQADGQVPGRRVGVCVEVHEVEDRARLLLRLRSPSTVEGSRSRSPTTPRGANASSGNEEVVERAELVEELEVLERPRDLQPRAAVRLEVTQVAPS